MGNRPFFAFFVEGDEGELPFRNLDPTFGFAPVQHPGLD